MIKKNIDSIVLLLYKYMKLELIKDLDYEKFFIIQMGDDEFMKRFQDGVPNL